MSNELTKTVSFHTLGCGCVNIDMIAYEPSDVKGLGAWQNT